MTATEFPIIIAFSRHYVRATVGAAIGLSDSSIDFSWTLRRIMTHDMVFSMILIWVLSKQSKPR